MKSSCPAPACLPACLRRRYVSQAEARASTLRVAKAFGLRLRHEPFPLWAGVPLALALTATLLLLLAMAAWRARIQAALTAGGEHACMHAHVHAA